MGRDSKLMKQLFLFSVVGGTSFLIDVSVTTALFHYLHFPAYLAGVIGFCSAFFFNFPINRKHVFNHSDKDRFSLKKQIILYFSLSIFNLLMTGVLMQWLVGTHLLNIGFAKACVTGLIAIWNFLLFRFFIFSKRPDQAELESLIIQ